MLSTQYFRFSMRLGLLMALSALVQGCSAVKFTTQADCGASSNCISEAGSRVYEDTLTATGGKVDLLIVNDNSASMSFEQRRLAQRFSRFVDQFDQRAIDYRIAVTTTDISSAQNRPRLVNQNGGLQDGQLLTFSNGQKFLTPASGSASQKEQLFNSIINRPETLACESFILGWSGSRDTLLYAQGYFDACPSSDERGIYAANLVVAKNSDSLIRSDADLAIIFLADEDVRSQMYWHNIPGFELADYDKANFLVSQIRSKFPSKTFGLHAIIVKDQNCLNQQNSQLGGLVSGSYGREYFEGTQLSAGVAGDICAEDYTQQLISIFNNIQGKIIDKIPLLCSGPQLTLELLTFTPNDPSLSGTVQGTQIVFNKKLPIGTAVKYRYRCKSGAT
jgi:hypothetical protein